MGGGGGCGEKFVKEQRDKSLLSLRAKNSDGYLLHCRVQNALRKIHIHIPLVNEMTHKKCKRTGLLTVNIFFPYLETVGAVAE